MLFRSKAFAESLRDQHPDVVEVVWKFNRWHHQVDYSPFIGNSLKLKSGVTRVPVDNEYEMRLSRIKDPAFLESCDNVCDEDGVDDDQG